MKQDPRDPHSRGWAVQGARSKEGFFSIKEVKSDVHFVVSKSLGTPQGNKQAIHSYARRDGTRPSLRVYDAVDSVLMQLEARLGLDAK
jgi:hypothetical protein